MRRARTRMKRRVQRGRGGWIRHAIAPSGSYRPASGEGESVCHGRQWIIACDPPSDICPVVPRGRSTRLPRPRTHPSSSRWTPSPSRPSPSPAPALAQSPQRCTRSTSVSTRSASASCSSSSSSGPAQISSHRCVRPCVRARPAPEPRRACAT